ncbi:hypothetical protein BUALT_Bualt03G0011400 [Buddleja alternifolia]|uniref:PB1-like domain-containing protein n=1 Tax=Buddleja alternifolia TaxID=168488 RepID=A0AAV6XQ50_9LAMI|nr:hypothetical protein BUALT_Bualt03G0011400 [Buddleja alternifolia]
MFTLSEVAVSFDLPSAGRRKHWMIVSGQEKICLRPGCGECGLNRFAFLFQRISQLYVTSLDYCIAGTMSADLFTLKVHHGGMFVNEGVFQYVGGTVTLFEELDPDFMSFYEILNPIRRLGYPPTIVMWYRLPNSELENGLRLIDSDRVVCTMFVEYSINKYVFLQIPVTNGANASTTWNSPTTQNRIQTNGSQLGDNVQVQKFNSRFGGVIFSSQSSSNKYSVTTDNGDSSNPA